MLTRRLLTVLILAALIVTAFPLAASAQSPSTYAAITLTGVTSGTPAVGSDFTTDVEVSVTTTGPGVTGVEVYIGYIDANVEPVDTDPSVPGVQPATLRPDFFGSNPFPAANEVITAPGIIAPGIPKPGAACPGPFPGPTWPCVHLVLVGPAQTSKTDVVARLHWRGEASGLAGFVVLNPYLVGGLPPPPPPPPPPFTALSDADGFVIPLNTFGVTPIFIVSAPFVGIGGIVRRQGVPPAGGPGTQCGTRITAASSVGFVGPAFTLAFPPPTLPMPQVNTEGGFFIVIPAGGTYTVDAHYPGYLRARKPNVSVSGGQVMIGPTRLYGGDVNGDNNVNILDLLQIIGSFGAAVPVGSAFPPCAAVEGHPGLPPAPPPPPDSANDINDDGVVNISDLAIAAGNFGRPGPTVWAP